MPNGEEDSDKRLGPREYKAFHGRKRPLLKFIPNDRSRRRYLPFSDIRNMEVTEPGDELQMEFSDFLVVLQGEGLEAVSDAIQGIMGSKLEAFDEKRHDPLPAPKQGDAPVPVIRNITFYTPKKKGPDELPQRRPAHEPETTAREKEKLQ